ncbi:GNAT family N-acetyltransferase [Streptomyces sp. NPDC088748]|uniref:GNAT family N-acetyltransferase n=1 Tax=Streptomyces sp. NPDC088748 TaxID=3365887 RepID=UPI003815BC71
MRWLRRWLPKREVPGEDWHYLPPAWPAGREQVMVTRADGYDFARLDWQACEACRTGLVIAVRVTSEYQGRGYAGRMLRYALRSRENYMWTTTVQKAMGKVFFRRMSQRTGVQFGDGRKPILCPHMRAAHGLPGPAQQMPAVD